MHQVKRHGIQADQIASAPSPRRGITSASIKAYLQRGIPSLPLGMEPDTVLLVPAAKTTRKCQADTGAHLSLDLVDTEPRLQFHLENHHGAPVRAGQASAPRGPTMQGVE